MEIKELIQEFINIYGGTEEGIRVFASPGRVNLIGEHTDYNGGYVFPAALKMKTTIIMRKRDDNIIRLKATDLDGIVEADISKLDSYKGIPWGDYQLGVAYILQNNGYDIQGVDLLYDDTVPHGGGLSSSAAIEVSTALLFATLSNEKNGITEPVDMIEMAKLAQKAEHEYAGVNCGIMDQFVKILIISLFRLNSEAEKLSFPTPTKNTPSVLPNITKDVPSVKKALQFSKPQCPTKPAWERFRQRNLKHTKLS